MSVAGPKGLPLRLFRRTAGKAARVLPKQGDREATRWANQDRSQDSLKASLGAWKPSPACSRTSAKSVSASSAQ